MDSWERKLARRVGELGFSSLADFLRQRPSAPYPALADELGPDVMGIQIVDLQLRGASEHGAQALREAAVDALVRFLRQIIPQGWSRTPSQDEGVTPEFMNIAAWSSWSSTVKHVAPDVEPAIDAAWERLNDLAPPGWLPADGEDPILVEVFDAAWPRPEVK